MTVVPHAQFKGALAVDAEFEHPPGATLARALERALRARFVSVQPFNNWRDCGWAVNVHIRRRSRSTLRSSRPRHLNGCLRLRHWVHRASSGACWAASRSNACRSCEQSRAKFTSSFSQRKACPKFGGSSVARPKPSQRSLAQRSCRGHEP